MAIPNSLNIMGLGGMQNAHHLHDPEALGQLSAVARGNTLPVVTRCARDGRAIRLGDHVLGTLQADSMQAV